MATIIKDIGKTIKKKEKDNTNHHLIKNLISANGKTMKKMGLGSSTMHLEKCMKVSL